MPLYTGCECPICGKAFESADDVVVCPICGSPHHRECYRAVGHCGNEDYHSENRQWEAPPPPPPEPGQQDVAVCHACGAQNPSGNFFCQSCGQRMGGTQDASGAVQNGQSAPRGAGVSPFANYINTNIDLNQVLDQGVTVKDACDYVGPNNLPFVLRFKEMAVNRRVMVNWSAFFFGFYYCFYRKMYKLGAVLLGIFFLTIVPTGYYSAVAVGEILAASGGVVNFPLEFVTDGVGYQGLMMLGGITRIISLGTMLFCGFYFNKAYYRQMINTVRRIKDSGNFSSGAVEGSYAVANAGGVNRMAILWLVLLMLAMYMAYGFLASAFILT